MSEFGRDVVRYIKAIEDTGGYRTIWRPNALPGGGTFCSCFAVLTADGMRARPMPSAADQLTAAARYISERYGPRRTWATLTR